MRIEKMEIFYVAVPLDRHRPGFFAQPKYFEPSWIPGFRQSEMRLYLLRLTTDSGIEGVAAITAMGAERVGVGPLLGNYLLGMDPLDIEAYNQRIQEASYLGTRNGWLDAAVWDIAGKIEGKPVYELLGGSGGSVAPYMSTGQTHGHDPTAARRLAARARDEGFAGIKLRVKGTDVGEMADYVGAAHDEAGGSLNLMVDANQGWPVDLIDETPRWNLDTATDFARRLEGFDVKWLEEPLHRMDFRALAALRRETSTPIAGGELNASWADFERMLELGSLDIYQPDAVLAGGTRAGGITVIHWLQQAIRNHNSALPPGGRPVKFCPHTWTTGLGFAVALHLVGAIPDSERSLIEYPMAGDWGPDVWARFIRGGFPLNQDGRIDIPDGPGLGIEIDWDVVRRFGRRVYKGTPASIGLAALRDRGYKQTMYLKSKREARDAAREPAQFRLPRAPDGPFTPAPD